MTSPPPRIHRRAGEVELPEGRARIPLLVGVLLVAALVVWSDDLHRRILDLIAVAEPIIRAHPIPGALIFMGLAALSAMLVFFSSVVLVPLGVGVWGDVGCFLLLWAGWFAGGVLTYTLGRIFGRPLVTRLVTPEKLERFERRVPRNGSFATALAAQLALPSDVSGYLFGLLSWRAPAYLAALALAELPYAVGTVFLGAAFVRGHTRVLMIAAGVAAVIGGVLWIRGRRGARCDREGPPGKL